MLIALAVLAGLLLRLPLLTQSLWYDELSATRLRLGDPVVLLHRILFDVSPHLYSMFLALWIRLAGDSELAVRMPAFLCGIFSIYLVFRVAERATDRRTALCAAFLLAVSPVHIWYSRDAKQYSALCLALLAALAAHFELERRSSWRWISLYGLSLASLVFMHFFSVLYVAALLLISLVEAPRRLARPAVAGAVLSAFALFMIVRSQFGSIAESRGYLRPFGLFELWMLFTHWLPHGNTIGSVQPGNAARQNLGLFSERPLLIPLTCFFALVLLRGLWLCLRGENRRARTVAALILAVPLFHLGRQLLGLEGLYIERSVFPMLPLFLIVSAKAISGPERGMLLPGYVASAALALALLFALPESWNVYKPNPDWRSAAAYIESEHDGRRSAVLASVHSLDLVYYSERAADTIDHDQVSDAGRYLAPFAARLPGGAELISSWTASSRGAADDRLARASLILEYPQPQRREVRKILERVPGEWLFFVRNLYWPGQASTLERVLHMDPALRFESFRAFPGLEVTVFRRLQIESQNQH